MLSYTNTFNCGTNSGVYMNLLDLSILFNLSIKSKLSAWKEKVYIDYHENAFEGSFAMQLSVMFVD